MKISLYGKDMRQPYVRYGAECLFAARGSLAMDHIITAGRFLSLRIISLIVSK